MRGLIGYTGFVGSNIYNQQVFDKLYNSKNIDKIDNEKFDVLIVSGIQANKQFANMDPENDLLNIKKLFDRVKTCKVNHLILISTIDVYSDNAYGRNRLEAENIVKENFNSYHILRLPALYGEGLKKNVLYDINHLAPLFIKDRMFEMLQKQTDIDLDNYYCREKNIYKLCYNSDELINALINVNFTSLQFTNIKSTFQFFNLNYIGYFIDKVLYEDLKEFDISSDPISVEEIISTYDYSLITLFNNNNNTIINYNDIHGYKWNSKEFILNDIVKFLN